MQDIILSIIQIIAIPLSIILVTFIVNLIKIKIKELQKSTEDLQLQQYLSLLDDAVNTAVAYINQTYVDELKRQNTFTETAQKEALVQAYSKVINTLSYEASDYLHTHIGEFSEYVVSKIEASVYNNKKGQEN